MKKLFIALSAAVLAVGVQASTLDWKYSITDSVGDAGAADNLTAYLFTAADWAALGDVSSQEDIANAALDSATFGVASTTGKSTKTYGFATKNADDVVDAKRAVSSDEFGSTVDTVIVIFDSAANAYQTSAVTMTTHGPSDASNNSGVSTITLANLTSGTWTEVVPEPTTVALLALGLAALGLKRKVA